MHTPQLIKEVPSYASCKQCDGSGVYHGIFTRTHCAYCYSTGYAALDGQALSLEALLTAIIQQRDYTLVMQMPRVQNAMAEHSSAQQEQAMGYGQNRYQGD